MSAPAPPKIVLAEKLALFDELWSPRVLAEANGQSIKIAKVHGEFVAHQHAAEDEVFLCLAGEFCVHFPASDETRRLQPGEMLVVPFGVEHRPFAEVESHIMIFEPKQTAHTGKVESDLTKAVDEQPWI